MEKLKLSEMDDAIEVSIKESHIVHTVAELKREILAMGEEHHLSSNWYTVIRHEWKPSATDMVHGYLDNETDDLYEDFYSAAMSELSNGAIEKIQHILDGVFGNNTVSDYWTYETPVEIDVFPSSVIE